VVHFEKRNARACPIRYPGFDFSRGTVLFSSRKSAMLEEKNEAKGALEASFGENHPSVRESREPGISRWGFSFQTRNSSAKNFVLRRFRLVQLRQVPEHLWRRFHGEGFVNECRLESVSPTPRSSFRHAKA
jgi:hypothetical protein